MEQPIKMEYEYCCFCHEIIERLQLIEVPNMTIEKCFEEMSNLNCGSFKSCEQCLQTLEDFCAFNIKCTSNAQKIKEYCSILNITSRDVNLYEVYQFLYNPSLSVDTKDNLTSAIKLEDEDNKVTTPAENKTEVVGQEQERDLKKNSIKTFNCEKCDCKYKSEIRYKSHLLVHLSLAEVKVLKCEECSFETKYKGIFRRHLLKHERLAKVQIFHCNLCTSVTSRKSYLKRPFTVLMDISQVKFSN